jgi:hypothetical protein
VIDLELHEVIPELSIAGDLALDPTVTESLLELVAEFIDSETRYRINFNLMISFDRQMASS